MSLFRSLINGLALCFLLVATIALPNWAWATVHQRSLPLDEAWQPDQPSARWLGEVIRHPDEDRSLRPSMTWWWLLEDGERIVSAELVEIQEEVVARLAREPQRVPLIGNDGSQARGEAEPLWDSAYELEWTAPRTLHGRHLQGLNLVPLRAEAGVLLALRQAELRLITESADGDRRAVVPLRPDFPLRDRMQSALGQRLLNPDALPSQADRAIGGSGFPTEVPSIEGSAVEMVIVTVDSFADLCQNYADERTKFGVPTVVRTVEWIAERYPFGSDRSELVRNFVKDAYAKWSIRFLLLAGDAPQIPPRYAYSEVFVDPVETPTDMYFACLDGDWNADGDQLWAEAADSNVGIIGDLADLLPEVNVGRLPAGNRSVLSILLDKSLSYHDCVDPDYQNGVLMLGEVLFPPDYPDPPYIIVDGAAYCESIYINSTDAAQRVTRLYQAVDSFPGSLPLTRFSAKDSMSAGQGLVLHNGHGARQTMSVGDGSLGAADIAALANGDQTFLLYMVNCTAAAFDFHECLAETFLQNDAGGAVGVIGSTRETFANISSDYQQVFFNHLYNDTNLRLGELHTASLNVFEPETVEDHGERWAHLTFTLLSDPSLWLHYERPIGLTVNSPSSIPLDGNPLTLSIEGPFGLPVEGAMVTIRKGEEDYQWTLTDAGGEVSFDLKAESGGVYQIRADRRDARPHFGATEVIAPGNAPHLSIATIQVDDVAGGPVIGNGNGLAERGETVRLILTLQNEGGQSATSVTAILNSAHGELNILDAVDSYGSIAAGGQDSGSDPYLVQVLEVIDDDILPFSLSISSGQGGFADDFFLEAASPLLEIYYSDIDDSNGGNGNGDIEEGETATVSVWFANYGRGTAPGVQATLEAPAGSGLVVIHGSADLGDLPDLSTGLGPAEFTVGRATADPLTLELHLTDELGHVDSFNLLLERPQGVPGAPQFTFGNDFSRLTLSWDPPVEEDADAYFVERAATEEGPFVQVSEHWVRSSAYEDTGFESSTYYWYRVVPLTDSGLPGVPSATVSVKTNPGLHTGWPVLMGGTSSGTPVVGDFSGNGENEIIVGADLVYGFHADGSELSNGDGDPETFGPISGAGRNYFSSLAATDLVPGGGLEVVASSWDTSELYMWQFVTTENGVEAVLAPGWPVYLGQNAGIWASPSMGDVDGDSDIEIFVMSTIGRLMAFHHDGSEVIDGDSNPGTLGVFATGFNNWSRSSAAFANVDGDPAMEIFVGSNEGKLYGFNGDGSPVPGFPFEVPGNDPIYSSPSVGDLDNDMWPELIFPAENESLYVVDRQGRRRPGWPIRWYNDNWALGPCAALADVTGDGFLEIFACSVHDYEHMEVAWFDVEGQMLDGWPVVASFSTQSSPVIGDLDGDGDLEAVLGNEFGIIEAWHHNGEAVDGFPLVLGDYVRAVPMIIDVDQDGSLNLLATSWDKKAYIWDFPAAHDPARTPWYTFLHDQKRTGNYATLDWIVDAGDAPAPPGIVHLDPNWPNPFNPTTTLRFTVPTGTAQQVHLAIYDIQGRQISELVNSRLEPGQYERSWDGRNDSGHSMASGIYFARLRVDENVVSRKLTLLK